MVLHNDAPQQHDNGNGGGGSGGGGCDGNRTVEAGRYVPFSSSGGARPLPYPLGPCGTVRRHYEKKEKGGNGGAGGVVEEISPSPPTVAIPSPTERHLADELAQGLKRKRGERRTGGRGRRNLETLLKVLGDEKAVLALIQLKGGNLFTVPKGENAQGKKRIQQLEETLGKEAAQKCVTYAGGTTFYIPRAAYLETDRRNREICLERDRIAKEHPDMPERKIVETLALKYHLSDNSVWRTLKRYYEFVDVDS